MKSQPDINRIFNKFAGREVRMKEKQVTSLGKFESLYKSGATFLPYTKIKPNWTDPTLLKMRFTAWAHGLRLFVMYPGHTVPLHAPFGPETNRENRVNAFLKKSADGKWRVHSSFSLG